MENVQIAAAVLLVGMTIGGSVYASDAKEYKAAKELFSQYGLSTEGLTRDEIVAFYREAASGSLTYDKLNALTAVVDNSAIPADVLEYAGGEGMAFMKEFMKRPGFGYIDEENQEDGGKFDSAKFSSAEEIDALTLGQGYRLSCLKTVVEERGDTVADSTCLTDRWIFELVSKNGPLLYSGVTKEADGRFTSFGALDAFNLSAALSVMKTLAINAGVSFEPVIMEANFEHLVAQNFNGDDRIVLVPGSWRRLDDEYFSVTWYGQLPTYKEYMDEYNASFIPYIDPETGEPIDLTKVPCGGSGDSMALCPDLSAKAPEKTMEKTINGGSRITVILPVAASVLIAAAMVIFALRRRKPNKD